MSNVKVNSYFVLWIVSTTVIVTAVVTDIGRVSECSTGLDTVIAAVGICTVPFVLGYLARVDF